MTQDILPSQSIPIDSAGNRASTPFYTWFQSLDRVLSGTASPQEIAAIEAKLRALQDQVNGLDAANIIGIDSVQTIGPMADGSFQIRLVRDSAAPGASAYYGTDVDGAKGYHALPVSPAVLPVVTGEVPPVLVYGDDGSLIYSEI